MSDVSFQIFIRMTQPKIARRQIEDLFDDQAFQKRFYIRFDRQDSGSFVERGGWLLPSRKSELSDHMKRISTVS